MRNKEEISQTIFDRFLENYQSGKMSVLVGAGLSMNVSDRYLSWKTLMKDIVRYLYKDQIDLYCENYLHVHSNEINNKEEIQEKYIDTILDTEDYLQIASKYIKKKGYREAIDYYIESHTPRLSLSPDDHVELQVAKGCPTQISASDLSVHKSLLKCRKFQNIYTTNYDNILEVTSEILSKENSFTSYNVVKSGKQLSGSLSHNIIKIHGSIEEDSKDFQFDGDRHLRYIIAQEDYDTYIQKHEAFSYLMRIVMLQGYFCLVGFSGTDPNYLAWVRWMSDILNTGNDDKIYLLDIDGNPIPEDLLSFYSNHHIVVINLWEKTLLEEILKKYSTKKGNGNAIFGDKTGSTLDEEPSVETLLKIKQEYDTISAKDTQPQEKENLTQTVREYKKIILECLFEYLYLSEEEDFANGLNNQDVTLPTVQNNEEEETIQEGSSRTTALYPNALPEAKALFYDYRNIWDEAYKLIKSNDDLMSIINKLLIIKSSCRFPTIIFPQESIINLLMTKEPLSQDKACLFALAVSDIGQIPSYYNNYRKDDVELNKQPLWIQLTEREASLRGSNEILNNDANVDWAIYEQIQRCLFHLDFSQAKELVSKWDAKEHWIQAKAMRMAVYHELRSEASTLLDKTIKKEKNPSEKFFEIILANYISRQWPRPYSTDEFWKYGLDGQGDLLNSMMHAFHHKEEKPKRRGWIGSTKYFGSNHGDYVKSLRILQFIIDSGVYLALLGIYMFDIASWYKVFLDLYEHFPYPCFFYSIQYNDQDVQRRIGEDFAYNMDLQDFVQDILRKSLSAISNPDTPLSFKTGILNITSAMYVAVNEDEWFDLFKETVFKEILSNLRDIDESDNVLYNAKFALGSLKKEENIYWVFQQLMNVYATNESVVSDLISYNLRINRLSLKHALKELSIFPDLLSKNTLDLLDALNRSKLLSDNCKEEIYEKIEQTPEENIPHDRVALLQLINLVRESTTAIEKIKRCILSMDIWHCGVLNDNEFGWTEPRYIMLHLLHDKITWTDDEFDIIKENLIKNVATYDNRHEELHQDTFMKNVQVRYLSSMLRYIDGVHASRKESLSQVRIDIERLLADRIQYANNIDLMMSEQPADVDNAFDNIYQGVRNYGIAQYRDEIDFMIDRAIMKTSVALTRNIKYIYLLVNEHEEDLIKLGYIGKIMKLLSTFEDSKTWKQLDVHFAFNYLYRMAKKLSESGKANSVLDFWLKDPFVHKFVVIFMFIMIVF